MRQCRGQFFYRFTPSGIIEGLPRPSLVVVYSPQIQDCAPKRRGKSKNRCGLHKVDCIGRNLGGEFTGEWLQSATVLIPGAGVYLGHPWGSNIDRSGGDGGDWFFKCFMAFGRFVLCPDRTTGGLWAPGPLQCVELRQWVNRAHLGGGWASYDYQGVNAQASW